MFGLLFGYGVAQIVRRQEAPAPRGVRRLLWRRSLVLIVVGFLHACCSTSATSWPRTACCCSSAPGRCAGRDRWLLVVAAAVLRAGRAARRRTRRRSAPSRPDALDAAARPVDAWSSSGPPVAAVRRAARPDRLRAARSWSGCGPAAGASWSSPERHRRLLACAPSSASAPRCSAPSPSRCMLAGAIDAARAGDALELIGPLHDATGILGGFGLRRRCVALHRDAARRLAPAARSSRRSPPPASGR